MTGLKRQFFESAVELFADKGYGNVSLHEVAEAVGKKAGNLNYYFRTKDDILALIYSFFESYYFSKLPSAETMAGTEQNNLQQFINWQESYFQDVFLDPLIQKILTIIITESRHDERAERLLEQTVLGTPRKYLSVFLPALVKSKVIEPLDVEGFIATVTAFDYFYAACCRIPSINIEQWNKRHRAVTDAMIKLIRGDSHDN